MSAPAFDRLLDGRRCRIVPRPDLAPRSLKASVTIEFEGGEQRTANRYDLKRVPR